MAYNVARAARAARSTFTSISSGATSDYFCTARGLTGLHRKTATTKLTVSLSSLYKQKDGSLFYGDEGAGGMG